MIIFNAPSREFYKGEIIIANPEGGPDSYLNCIAISGGSVPFIANGVACSYGEPNPYELNDQKKRIHGHFKHHDFIALRNFVDGTKYLHAFLNADTFYFQNAMVDDGSLDVLKKCNGVINRAIQLKDIIKDPLLNKMLDQIRDLELFDINLYQQDLDNAPKAFPEYEDEYPVRLYLSAPQNIKDLINPGPNFPFNF